MLTANGIRHRLDELLPVPFLIPVLISGPPVHRVEDDVGMDVLLIRVDGKDMIIVITKILFTKCTGNLICQFLCDIPRFPGDDKVIALPPLHFFKVPLRFHHGIKDFRDSTAGIASGQKSVSIYKKDNGPATPVTTYSDLGCYLKSKQLIYTPGTDQYIRSRKSSNLSFILLNPETEEKAEIVGYQSSLKTGDDVSISLHWTQRNTVVRSQTYAMQVMQDDGDKVWIGDSKGNGFIIKK